MISMKHLLSGINRTLFWGLICGQFCKWYIVPWNIFSILISIMFTLTSLLFIFSSLISRAIWNIMDWNVSHTIISVNVCFLINIIPWLLFLKDSWHRDLNSIKMGLLKIIRCPTSLNGVENKELPLFVG